MSPSNLRLALAAMGLLALGSHPPCKAQAPWSTVAPSLLEQTGTFQDRRIRESSGVAPSRLHPGILWTHNDSGDRPFIYATNLSGAALGAYRIGHATNVDWEDIAIGPCPAVSAAGACLYVSDLGDNSERRHGGTIYIVPEPAPPGGAADTSRVIEPIHSIRVTYGDGSHDTEAIMVSAAGDVSLVTKGRSGVVLRFLIHRDALAANALTLNPHDTLPIMPARNLGRLVTGAAVSPSGRRAVIRTYTELYFFRPDGDRLIPDGPACWIGPTEPQGEGVGFLDENVLVLTSEALLGEPGTIYRARCPSGQPK